MLPPLQVIQAKSLEILNFLLEVISANRLRSVLVLITGAAAAASQAYILLLLNQGLTRTPVDGEFATAPIFFVAVALTLTVIAAWLHFVSSRFVVAIWIARLNQNLVRLDVAIIDLRVWINAPHTEQWETDSRTKIATRVLSGLRTLSIRQGLAVRAAFGMVTTAMNLAGLLLSSFILDAALTFGLLALALLVVVPFAISHGALMVSNEREFLDSGSSSSRAFLQSIEERFSDSSPEGESSFADEASHLRMSRALARRLNTPNWNRAIAVSVLIAGIPMILAIALLFGYQLPTSATLVVLLIALLAALAQVATLSALVTTLGRFLDSIVTFQSVLGELEDLGTDLDTKTVTRLAQAVAGGSTGIEEP